ncbi:MAG: hydroxyacid dehydrogenase [Opitutales bacterium]
MKIGVLIPKAARQGLFHDSDLERLEALGEVIWWSGEAAPTLEEATALLADCEVAVSTWGSPTPKPELLADCPHLKLWEHVAGSVKGHFNDAVVERGLMVASCKSAIAECVAEMVLGLMIVGVRRVPQDVAGNRDNRPGKPSNLKTLADCTIGVIAASEVGKLVIRNLQPFGPRIRLFDPFTDEAGARKLGVSREEDLVELCRTCDAVTLHTPLLEATRRMLKAEHFQAMADDTLFINTSRGPCIDEAALIAELQKGRLFACLDVSDPEPPAADSPLRRLPNVWYTSHIAGPASRLMGRQCAEDLEAYARGGKPRVVVTADDLDRVA